MRGLDYPSERYVRLYTRDTIPWIMLPWQSKAIYPEMRRKADHRGLIMIEEVPLSDALQVVFEGWPTEVVSAGFSGLIDRNWVEHDAESGIIKIVDWRLSEKGERPPWRELFAPVDSRQVYLMRCGDEHKIGFSKHPESRLKQIRRQEKRHSIAIVATGETEDYRRAESLFHQIFALQRRDGEWFALEPHDVKLCCSLLADLHEGLEGLEQAASIAPLVRPKPRLVAK